MKTINEILPEMLKGDSEAVAFNLALYEIVETWDDLIDHDPATPSAINGAFYAALVTLPRNGFYQRHFALLNPLIESAILDWYAANAFEAKGDAESLRASYMLRCQIQAVTVMCARIIGGVGWANKVNLELRSAGDTWAEYSSEHGVA